MIKFTDDSSGIIIYSALHSFHCSHLDLYKWPATKKDRGYFALQVQKQMRWYSLSRPTAYEIFLNTLCFYPITLVYLFIEPEHLLKSGLFFSFQISKLYSNLSYERQIVVNERWWLRAKDVRNSVSLRMRLLPQEYCHASVLLIWHCLHVCLCM